jgi:hypothetical protein
MRAPNAIVEVQMEGESAAVFEGRVLERIRRTREHGDVVIAAGYACGLSDGSRDASRLRLGAELVEVIQRLPEEHPSRARGEAGGTQEAGEAELIVAGGAWEFTGADALERDRLLELWSKLSASSPGKVVSVRFEEQPFDSGVFRVAYQREAAVSG